jgi:hypothetical protein
LKTAEMTGSLTRSNSSNRRRRADTTKRANPLGVRVNVFRQFFEGTVGEYPARRRL